MAADRTSRFFDIYTDTLHALEKEGRGSEYALIGGYACRYWHDLYFPSKKSYRHKDLDIRGGLEEAEIIASEDLLTLYDGPFLHNTRKYTAVDKIPNPRQEVEIFPLIPVLDEKDGLATEVLQGIVYRVPNNFDKILTISVLDPFSLLLTKIKALGSTERQIDPRYKDKEHIGLLVEVIPACIKDLKNGRFQQIHSPPRDIRTAARRLYQNIEAQEIPEGIDGNQLLLGIAPMLEPTNGPIFFEPEM